MWVIWCASIASYTRAKTVRPAYPQRGSSNRRSARSVLTTSVLILPCSSTYVRVALGALVVIVMVGRRGIQRSNSSSSTTSSSTLENPSARRFAACENPLHVMSRPNWAPTSVTNPANVSTCVAASFQLNNLQSTTIVCTTGNPANVPRTRTSIYRLIPENRPGSRWVPPQSNVTSPQDLRLSPCHDGCA